MSDRDVSDRGVSELLDDVVEEADPGLEDSLAEIRAEVERLRAENARLESTKADLLEELQETNRGTLQLTAELEERYRQLFESAVEGIYTATPEVDRYTLTNPAMADILGYEDSDDLRDAVTNIRDDVFVDPDRYEEYRTRLRTAGQLSNFEYRVRRTDGEVRWVSDSATELIDDDGTVAGFRGGVVDITERKTREQALERLHASTRDLLGAKDPAQVASIACDTATEVLDEQLVGVHLYDAALDSLVPVAWSDALEAVTDGPPPSIPAGEGLAWQAYADEESRIYADVRGMEGVFDTDTPFRSEVHLPLDTHGVIIVGSTEPDDFDATDETLAGMLTANVEATLDRVERERDLAEERNKYETVVERSYDGITIVRDGEFVFANPRSLDILGYEKSELIGTPLVDVIAPGDRDLVRSRSERRVDSNSESPPSQYEATVRTSDGETRIVEITAALIQYEGEPADLKIFRDVTERKRYEERLEKTTEELEALNRVVRHDIRNDMAVVLGWAELLEDHVDEDGEEYLRKVLASGDHVVELTEIARDYIETLTSDDDDLAVSPIPLRPILETELDLRRESFPNAEFRLTGEVPDVEIQANQMLGSVFRNLLNNAVQHNDKDDPVVTVSCEIDDDDVVVHIADNGPGISDDQKGTVFGKGAKGIDSAGTGIGLYLVQTLVRQYDGAVEVADNDPEGAVFTVRLPISG